MYHFLAEPLHLRSQNLLVAPAKLFVAICCFSLWGTMGVAGDIDTGVIEQYKAAAPAVYGEASAALQSIDVDGEYRLAQHWNKPDRQDTDEVRAKFHISRQAGIDGFRLTWHQEPPEDFDAEDFVKNDRYWFRLKRQDETGASYELFDGAMIGKTTIKGGPGTKHIFRVTTFESYLDAGMRIWTLPLLRVFSDPDFKIIEARWSSSQHHKGENIARFGFEYLGNQRDGARYPSGKYWAEVNPRNSWLVDRSGLEVPLEGFYNEITVTFQERADAKAFPKSVLIKGGALAKENDEYREETLVTFAAPSPLHHADNIFYLQYYGIPEAAIASHTPAPWLRWLLLNIGIGGCALAIWMIWRQRRSGRAATVRT